MIRRWVVRHEARALADAALVRAWLDVNSHLPLGALWANLPISARRIHRALLRLQADLETEGPRVFRTAAMRLRPMPRATCCDVREMPHAASSIRALSEVACDCTRIRYTS